jgi:choline dehydrogenase-like flavoprotein
MARIHLAAGAQTILTFHGMPVQVSTEADLKRLESAPYGPHEHVIFTAHQMGGAPMGADPRTSVVDPEHRLRGTDNVFVVDGSVFPTSLGVNPSETIYALAHRAVDFVAKALA